MINLRERKRDRGHAPRSYLSLVLGVFLGVVCAVLGAAYWPAVANAPRRLVTSRQDTYMYPGCRFSFSKGGSTDNPGPNDVCRVDEFLVTDNWVLRPLAPYQGIFDLGDVTLGDPSVFPASVEAYSECLLARHPSGHVPEPRLVTGHVYWARSEYTGGRKFRVLAFEMHPVARALIEYTGELPFEAAPGKAQNLTKASSDKDYAAAQERVGEALRQLRWKISKQIPQYRDGLQKQADTAQLPIREDEKAGSRPGREEELKQIAGLLTAANVHELACKETIVRLEIAQRTLQRASWLGDLLGQKFGEVPRKVREAEQQAAARLKAELGKELGYRTGGATDARPTTKGAAKQVDDQDAGKGGGQ